MKLPWNDPIQESHVCGTTKALKLSIDQDQFFKERYINQELKVRQRLRENNNLSTSGVYQIKVYFHVIGSSANQSQITTSVLEQQITALNADFRKTHGNTPARWSSVAADTNIQFAWNSSDLNRVTTSSSFPVDNSMKYTSSGGSDAHQANIYLNVWICELEGGVLGYAQFGGNVATDESFYLLTLYQERRDKLRITKANLLTKLVIG